MAFTPNNPMKQVYDSNKKELLESVPVKAADFIHVINELCTKEGSTSWMLATGLVQNLGYKNIQEFLDTHDDRP
jgi:hypothetical protein